MGSDNTAIGGLLEHGTRIFDCLSGVWMCIATIDVVSPLFNSKSEKYGWDIINSKKEWEKEVSHIFKEYSSSSICHLDFNHDKNHMNLRHHRQLMQDDPITTTNEINNMKKKQHEMIGMRNEDIFAATCMIQTVVYGLSKPVIPSQCFNLSSHKDSVAMSMFCAASSGFKNLVLSQYIPYQAYELCYQDYKQQQQSNNMGFNKLDDGIVGEVLYEACIQGVSEYAQGILTSPYGQTELDHLDIIPIKSNLIENLNNRNEYISKLNNMKSFTEDIAFELCYRFVKEGDERKNVAAFGACMGGALKNQRHIGGSYGKCTVANLWELIQNIS